MTDNVDDRSESEDYRTYSPEYADLPEKENSLSGYEGRLCPECGELGSMDAKIALTRDDETYSLWTVWRCETCEMRWRASSRPILTPFSTTTEDPEYHGYEVVGHE